MGIETAKRIWDDEYKSSIQLLIDNGEASFRPGALLMFCAIEHAYRAIHCIPEKEPCIQDAIRWAMPYYSKEELKERAAHQVVGANEWEEIDTNINTDVDQIRIRVFNSLKHAGASDTGITIDGDRFGFMSGYFGSEYADKEDRYDSFKIHILGFWDMVASRIDAEYERALKGSA